jgi:2-polyprenyl-6-methoxyphenol hydroxylase-like FAD-dependent oxidoreductase
LYDAAIRAGAEIKFHKKVTSVDPSIPSLTLEDGSIVKTDLIIGADG